MIPLDTLAVEPATFSTFLAGSAAAEVRDLGAGEALLTETSAALRHLRAGATIELDGGVVRSPGSSTIGPAPGPS